MVQKERYVNKKSKAAKQGRTIKASKKRNKTK